jgi:hypothetical protein
LLQVLDTHKMMHNNIKVIKKKTARMLATYKTFATWKELETVQPISILRIYRLLDRDKIQQ